MVILYIYSTYWHIKLTFYERQQSYSEMSGLSRELVGHRLLIKDGFRPYNQPVWRFNPKVNDRVKEEVSRLLEANCIRPCRYCCPHKTSISCANMLSKCIK
jgi:hypothetical protein